MDRILRILQHLQSENGASLPLLAAASASATLAALAIFDSYTSTSSSHTQHETASSADSLAALANRAFPFSTTTEGESCAIDIASANKWLDVLDAQEATVDLPTLKKLSHLFLTKPHVPKRELEILFAALQRVAIRKRIVSLFPLTSLVKHVSSFDDAMDVVTDCLSVYLHGTQPEPAKYAAPYFDALSELLASSRTADLRRGLALLRELVTEDVYETGSFVPAERIVRLLRCVSDPHVVLNAVSVIDLIYSKVDASLWSAWQLALLQAHVVEELIYLAKTEPSDQTSDTLSLAALTTVTNILDRMRGLEDAVFLLLTDQSIALVPLVVSQFVHSPLREDRQCAGLSFAERVIAQRPYFVVWCLKHLSTPDYHIWLAVQRRLRAASYAVRMSALKAAVAILDHPTLRKELLDAGALLNFTEMLDWKQWPMESAQSMKDASALLILDMLLVWSGDVGAPEWLHVLTERLHVVSIVLNVFEHASQRAMAAASTGAIPHSVRALTVASTRFLWRLCQMQPSLAEQLKKEHLWDTYVVQMANLVRKHDAPLADWLNGLFETLYLSHAPQSTDASSVTTIGTRDKNLVQGFMEKSPSRSTNAPAVSFADDAH
jgi:hypothetical protein